MLLYKTLFAIVIGVGMLLSAPFTSAQSVFKVLAKRGTVTIKSGAVKIGQQLTVADELKLDKSGYISLAHKNGRTVELSKAGSYKVKDLDAKASKKTGSSTSKFASYVATQLTEVDDPIEFSDNRRTKMRTTGSVERAAGDEVQLWDSVLAVVGAPGEMAALSGKQAQAVASGTTLAVIMPTHSRLLSDSIAMMWHRSPKVSSYKVVVIDRANAVTATFTTSDTVALKTVADLKLKPGQVYYWHVENAADAKLTSDQYALYLLAGEERAAAEALLADVRSDIGADDEAISQLVLASAFEEMGLYLDAHQAYQTAIRLAPDVPNYKRLYADYLKRQGLEMDAYVAYQ